MELLGAPLAKRIVFDDESDNGDKNESPNLAENNQECIPRDDDDDNENDTDDTHDSKSVDLKTALRCLEKSRLNPSQRKAIREFLRPHQQVSSDSACYPLIIHDLLGRNVYIWCKGHREAERYGVPTFDRN